MIREFDVAALDLKLRVSQHTCIVLCDPFRGHHAFYDGPTPRPATPIGVTWHDRLRLLLYRLQGFA